MVAAGLKHTSGLKGGFVSSSPYRFTGNPQYLGDIVFLVGVSVIGNSLLLWITQLLIALVFVVVPLAEKPCLKGGRGRVPGVSEAGAEVSVG